MNSCLYECSVMHHRLAPKEHHFRYRIFMFYLDLDELDEIASRTPLFSRNRFNLYTFRDTDHLRLNGNCRRAESHSFKSEIRNPKSEINERHLSSAAKEENVIPRNTKQSLIAWLAQNGVEFPADGRVMLLTLPRVLGHIFNPVSFYFCFDSAGAPFCAVAEVGNTFGEIKPFLIRGEDSPEGNLFHRIVPKHFYVSPFSNLDLQFDFKLRVPGDKLEIHIDDREGNDRVLLSALTGSRVALTNSKLTWLTLKYPLITLKVISLIHWNAFVLWLKKVPWHRKSANADLQRDVFNPHASITGRTK